MYFKSLAILYILVSVWNCRKARWTHSRTSYFNYLKSISFGNNIALCFANLYTFRDTIVLRLRSFSPFRLLLSPSPFSRISFSEDTRRAIQNENNRNSANDFYTKAEARVDYVISHYRTHFPVESHLDNRKHCLKRRYLRAKYTDGNPDVPLFLSRAPFAPGSTNCNCGTETRP